jgi:hypothetical protein
MAPAISLTAMTAALAAILGCAPPMQAAPVQASAAAIVPDDVIGRWKEPKLGFVVEIERQGDRYVMIGIADAHGVIPTPEVIGELRADLAGDGQFVGRHPWGGRWGNPQQTPKRWGQDGGLRIRQLAKDKIFVQLTDSRYTGGWTYLREAPKK